MSDSLQQLTSVLQTLALPVTGQVRLVSDDCTRVGVLASAFNAAHHTIGLDGSTRLTPEQVTALRQLGDRLAEVGAHSSICSESSMRQSPEWRQIRGLARASLVAFGLSLEVPLRAQPAGSTLVSHFGTLPGTASAPNYRSP